MSKLNPNVETPAKASNNYNEQNGFKMAETGNIETLAKMVSRDIFQWFKWKSCPLTDVNWECVLEEHTKKKTHPSDVVYYYDEPYSGKTTYTHHHSKCGF